MNPIMKCDGERRALLMNYDLLPTKTNDPTTLPPSKSGGYGSIAVRAWLYPDVSEKLQDCSESSSTCCSSSSSSSSSSCDDDMASSSSIRSTERLVHISEHNDDKDNEKKQPSSNKVKTVYLQHQNTSLTASTSSFTTTSFSDYDCDNEEDANDVEMGGIEVLESTIDEQDIVDEEHRLMCGDGRKMTFPGWEAYNKSLDEKPVTTKALTSLTGWFLGDLVTQTVISGGPFDLHRSIVLSSFGLFFHGPAGHIIYDNLDKVIDGKGPKEIAAKIMVDQMIWCPIFMICYFTYLGLANGDMPSIIIAKIHSDLWTAVQGSWKVWILAHAIQFRYVATKHRIIYINCVEVCFIMFLSFLGNR